MRVNHWLLLLLGVIAVTAFAGGPTATPAASPTPTVTPALPALMGTPMPIPNEPITPDNLDRLQQLAMWGRGAAKHAAFSPDGQTLAIGTTAGVWLHDAKTWALRRFILTDAEINALAFLADGQLMAQVGDKTINRWDVTTGALAGSWSLDTERNSIDRTAFAPDGTRVAASLEPGTGQVGLWGVPGGRLLSVLDNRPGSERVLSSLAFSPDGSRLACAMEFTSKTPNNAVDIWDVKTGALIRTLLLPEQSELSNIIFSADGKLLAVANNKDIFVWQVETGELLHTLTGHTGSMLSLAFSPDGAQLASASFDKTVRLWSVAEGRLLHTLPEPTTHQLVFSADGTVLVSAPLFANDPVNLWDTATGALLGEVEGYADGITGLAVAADGTVYTTQPCNLGLRRWDISTGQITRHYPEQYVGGLTVSANGQILAAGHFDPYDHYPSPSVLVWNAATGQLLQTLKDYSNPLLNLALSPDGNWLVSSESRFNIIYIHNTQTGQRSSPYLQGNRGAGKGATTKLAFSPDGLKLAIDRDKIDLFEFKTGKLLFTLDEDVSSTFSPDGTMIATRDGKGQINLRKADTGEIVRPLGKGYSPTFSPDGRMVLASVAGEVYLWEVATGRLLRAVTGIPYLEQVRFLPDGKMLLSRSSYDGGIARFWGIPPQ